MAKRIKTGIVAIGLGLLLGLGTPTLAKDIREQPKTQTTQEEQEPALAYPIIKEYVAYETKILQNDAKIIKVKIDYKLAILLADQPFLEQKTIVLTGKKQNLGNIKLEEVWHYSKQPTKIYQKNEINPIVKVLAEKILTEKTYKENSEPDALIYELFEALNAELIKV
ncbi:MAG: hypothetical protein Q8O03_08455 [Nanoarchaeota archaeon]|nr:hypothetical protein [Nanoarchaeota archaeon]